jgi:hypothetical protein
MALLDQAWGLSRPTMASLRATATMPTLKVVKTVALLHVQMMIPFQPKELQQLPRAFRVVMVGARVMRGKMREKLRTKLAVLWVVLMFLVY